MLFILSILGSTQFSGSSLTGWGVSDKDVRDGFFPPIIRQEASKEAAIAGLR